MIHFVTVSQVSVNVLLHKANGMFPEGEGAPRAFVKDGRAADMTNELLENATSAIKELWKQRGYDPTKPEQTKAKLGYALDKYVGPGDCFIWKPKVFQMKFQQRFHSKP